jgi:hypothetical protein
MLIRTSKRPLRWTRFLVVLLLNMSSLPCRLAAVADALPSKLDIDYFLLLLLHLPLQMILFPGIQLAFASVRESYSSFERCDYSAILVYVLTHHYSSKMCPCNVMSMYIFSFLSPQGVLTFCAP